MYFFTHVFSACFSCVICVQYGRFTYMKCTCNTAMPVACTVLLCAVSHNTFLQTIIEFKPVGWHYWWKSHRTHCWFLAKPHCNKAKQDRHLYPSEMCCSKLENEKMSSVPQACLNTCKSAWKPYLAKKIIIVALAFWTSCFFFQFFQVRVTIAKNSIQSLFKSKVMSTTCKCPKNCISWVKFEWNLVCFNELLF